MLQIVPLMFSVYYLIPNHLFLILLNLIYVPMWLKNNISMEHKLIVVIICHEWHQLTRINQQS